MSTRPDWKEVVDTASGKTYYYNRRTRETSWSPPDEGFEPAAGKKKKAAAGAGAGPRDTNSTAPSGSTNGGGGGGGGGSTNGSGSTSGGGGGNTTAEGGDGAGDDDGPLPPDWKRVTDPTTRKPYYYNKRTKVTSWKRPQPEAGAGSTSGPGAAAAAPAAAPASTSGGAAPSETAESTTGGGTNKKRRQRTGQVSADGQWEQVIDPGTQKKYWYNKVTKATAWVLPSSSRVAEASDEKDDGGARDANPSLARAASQQSVTESAASGADDAIERPSDRMMRLKQAMQEQQSSREADAVGSDEDEDDPAHEFRFSKHRHGWFNRTFRVGSVADEETLLQFKKSLIKKALLKKNREMDAEAIQAFKNIMNYMGDRKTSKPAMDNAKKLLSNAMSHPSGLRDEIYLQLIKQTSKNPKVTSTIKGCELLNFCLCCFPPSKALKKFMVAHFKQVMDDPATDSTVARMIEQAQQTLEVVIGLGQRKEVPSETELNCIREGKPVPVRINLVNGTFKTLHVSSFTTAKDIEEQMSAKMNLTLHTPFALYESSATDDNKERIVEAKERVLDIMSSWERAPETEEIKEMVPGGTKKDVRIKIVERPRFNQFSFKAKLVLKTSDPDVLADPEAVNLLYLQAIHDIVTWRYPVKEKDITVLAALQLQASFGDWQEDAHVAGWLSPKLPEFMPTHLLEGKKGVRSDQLAQEWEQTILSKYSKITGFTSLEAKLNYLDYVQEWPFYGATFFTVEQRQFKDYPSPINLGITCEGVILMHPQKRTLLESYSYAEIVTWGHSDERFIVVVGNIVQQRKLIFKTRDGKAANSLIHDYVKFKVKAKMVQ